MPFGISTNAVMVSTVPLTPIIGGMGQIYCFEWSSFNCFVPPGSPVPYRGFCIDTSGAVWGYDSIFRSPEFYEPSNGIYTKAQLDAKFGFFSQQGKLHPRWRE